MTRAFVVLVLALALGLGAGPARAQSLYWLDTNYSFPTLNRSDLDGLSVATLSLPAGTLPEGLAADANGRIYWTEATWTGADVQRVLGDLTGSVSLVAGGSVLRGIAIDQTAQMLFWTSSNLSTGASVMRSTLGGIGAGSLITLSAAANPRGIAVDHAANKIYWADFDQDAIYAANLDGSSPAVWLALTPGSGPYGIATNPATQRVYWTEYGSGLLRRADPGGTNVTSLLMGLANPTHLAFDEAGGRLYWTEGGVGAQRIRRANIDGSGLVNLPPPLTTYGGIGIGSGSAVPVTEIALPSEVAIDRVWPTPGSGPLHVAFSLPRETPVKLSILDLQGRVVAVLADGTVPAGRHERLWGARAGRGAGSAGVYFARLEVEGRTWVRRLVLTH